VTAQFEKQKIIIFDGALAQKKTQNYISRKEKLIKFHI